VIAGLLGMITSVRTDAWRNCPHWTARPTWNSDLPTGPQIRPVVSAPPCAGTRWASTSTQPLPTPA
jgi:hypothetical protein